VELEELAGADVLDADGVLDLAEVRWRTGDLAGAAAAAGAWLDAAEGVTDPGLVLANVICAEGAAQRADPDAVAAHVAAANSAALDGGALERLLAGIPPLAPWAVDDALAAPDELPAAGARHRPGGPGATPSGAPLAPAAASLVASGSALLVSHPERAAILFALAMRADRAAAEAVLAALDGAAGSAPSQEGPGDDGAMRGTSGEAGLAFARGDALRAAGRPEEARIAYASAERLALAPAEAGPSGSPK
jgi:hypothetical protein